MVLFQRVGAYICSTPIEVVNIIQGYSAKGKEDAVISVYMSPSNFIINDNDTSEYSGQGSPIFDEFNLEKPTSLNGYVPINKKLLTFPYCYINVSNNNGSSNVFQYELFNNDIKFNIKGVPVIGGSVKCVPYNYKNSEEYNNEEEGIMARKISYSFLVARRIYQLAYSK